MARKATTAAPVTPAAAPAALPAAERARAERVLASQGRAIGWLDSFPLAVQRQIAALCQPSGLLVPGTSDKFAELLANYYAEQKAAVDDEPTNQGFGQPAPATQPEAGQPST